MADKIAAEDFSKMKVAELRKELKERGLPLSGSKSELVDRLNAAVETEEATTETIATEDSILDDNVDLSDPEPASKPAGAKKDKAEPVIKKLTSTEEKSDATETKPKVASTSLSAAERLKQRAERFGVVNEDMKKQLRADRFGVSSGASKLSTAGTGADSEALKKRAERFGQVLAPTLSKEEDAEKIRKRKERFGDLTSATNNGPNKAKLVKVNASSEEEEQKKKRAERFGKA